MTYEKYFGDKINWKLFNLFTDKCMKYEDLGFHCTAAVGVISDLSNSEYILLYETGHDTYWRTLNRKQSELEELLKGYEKYGFRYYMNANNYEIANKLYKDINNTGRFTFHCKMQDYIFSEKK